MCRRHYPVFHISPLTRVKDQDNDGDIDTDDYMLYLEKLYEDVFGPYSLESTDWWTKEIVNKTTVRSDRTDGSRVEASKQKRAMQTRLKGRSA